MLVLLVLNFGAPDVAAAAFFLLVLNFRDYIQRAYSKQLHPTILRKRLHPTTRSNDCSQRP